MRPRLVRVTTLLTLSSLWVAYGGVGSASGSSARTVGVRLREFSLKPDDNYVKPGRYTFKAHNTGITKHEMVVVRADSIDTLPRKPDGSVNEDQIPETQKAGETGEFAPHHTKKISLRVKPGTYVLFCNIVQNTTSGTVSHFARGMHIVFYVSK
jgi:hypothetical protein